MNVNITAVRKQVRAIHYRLQDASQLHCVPLHVRELLDELPKGAVRDAVERFADEFAKNPEGRKTLAAYQLIVALLPPKTYGEVTAGSLFSVPGLFEVIRKTKQGIEVGQGRTLYAHLPANQIVII